MIIVDEDNHVSFRVLIKEQKKNDVCQYMVYMFPDENNLSIMLGLIIALRHWTYSIVMLLSWMVQKWSYLKQIMKKQSLSNSKNV